MRADLDALEVAAGHRFADREILRRALTHSSHVHEQAIAGGQATARDKEQLEFLGDSVLGFLISEDLLQRHPEAAEGRLSKDGPPGPRPTPSSACRNCRKPLVLRPKEPVQGDPRRPGGLPHKLFVQHSRYWKTKCIGLEPARDFGPSRAREGRTESRTRIAASPLRRIAPS